jgi:hypothetical protein
VIDVRLIAFSEDGGVGPSFAANDAAHAMEHEMGRVSVVRYHLSRPHLVEQRMLRLAEVKEWIRQADEHLARHVRDNTLGAPGGCYRLKVARDRLADVRAAAAPDAEFSSAVEHLIIALATTSFAADSIRDTL